MNETLYERPAGALGQTDIPVPELKPTPALARYASDYGAGGKAPCGGGRKRPAADPIGTGGLPDSREDLHRLLLNLCERLIASGGEFVRGPKLAAELEIPDTRSLRLLVAYGHVHHRLRQIVGLPGAGYCWGDLRAGVYEDVAAMSRRMGLCFLFNASLASHKPAAVEMAQLALEFAEESGWLAGGAAPAINDEVSAWLSTEGVSHSALIEAMIEKFNTTDAGRAALAEAGSKHPGVFIQDAQLREIERSAAELLQAVQSARKVG